MNRRKFLRMAAFAPAGAAALAVAPSYASGGIVKGPPSNLPAILNPHRRILSRYDADRPRAVERVLKQLERLERATRAAR